MKKPASYINKTDSELLRYYQRILQDVTFCDQKAAEFGFGAAGDHYRKAAKEARAEAERAKIELQNREVMQ